MSFSCRGIALALGVLCLSRTDMQAQSAAPAPWRVYAEVSGGVGLTYFSGQLEDQRQAREQQGFTDNRFGSNIATFFYFTHERVRGLGLGFGGKGTFGAGSPRSSDEARFFFNGYHFGLAAKYFPISQVFNRGFYVSGQLGFGQFTQKLSIPSIKTYEHQYGIGPTGHIGLGYAVPVGPSGAAFTFSVAYEASSRRGDIDGVGDNQTFTSSQASIMVGFSF
jgi:hypothetical protein